LTIINCYLNPPPNPSKGGARATEIKFNIAIDIENILKHIACVFFNPYSRFPTTSALKKGRMFPPIGAILKSFGFY
jgi:hypothetical protein